jgi:hypothetical protein
LLITEGVFPRWLHNNLLNHFAFKIDSNTGQFHQALYKSLKVFRNGEENQLKRKKNIQSEPGREMAGHVSHLRTKFLLENCYEKTVEYKTAIMWGDT